MNLKINDDFYDYTKILDKIIELERQKLKIIFEMIPIFYVQKELYPTRDSIVKITEELKKLIKQLKVKNKD